MVGWKKGERGEEVWQAGPGAESVKSEGRRLLFIFIFVHLWFYLSIRHYQPPPPHLLSLSVAPPSFPSLSLSPSVCCAICELYSRLMLTLCRFYRFSVNSVKHLKRNTTHPPCSPCRRARPPPGKVGLTAPRCPCGPETRANDEDNKANENKLRVKLRA